MEVIKAPEQQRPSKSEIRREINHKKTEFIQRIEIYAGIKAAWESAGRRGSKPVTLTYLNEKGEEEQKTVPINRSTVSAMKKEIHEYLNELVTFSTETQRIRRQNRPSDDESGFNIPYFHSTDLCEFLAHANIGTLVLGNIINSNKQEKKKKKPTVENMNVRPENLNTILFFTQKTIAGTPNPFYGFTSHSAITSLLALHLFYCEAQNKQRSSELSATPQMRKYLGGIIRQHIEENCAKIIEAYPENLTIRSKARAVADQALQAIDNPDLVFDNVVDGKWKIFNPNKFIYANLSSLIAVSKEKNQPTEEVRKRINKETYRLFRNNPMFKVHFDTCLPRYKTEEEMADNSLMVMEKLLKNYIQCASYRKDKLREEKKQEEAARADPNQTVVTLPPITGDGMPAAGSSSGGGAPGFGVSGPGSTANPAGTYVNRAMSPTGY